MVSIGLFAIVMTLVAGAYLEIINATRQAQSISTAVDSVSYALDDMARTIRTGTGYGCPAVGTDCAYPGGGSTFTVTDQNGVAQTYTIAGGKILDNNVALTDPTVSITSLKFYASGTAPDNAQGLPPYVTMLVSGTVVANKETYSFNVETSAVMRGINL
jgi:hypothetical protein